MLDNYGMGVFQFLIGRLKTAKLQGFQVESQDGFNSS